MEESDLPVDALERGTSAELFGIGGNNVAPPPPPPPPPACGLCVCVGVSVCVCVYKPPLFPQEFDERVRDGGGKWIDRCLGKSLGK